MSLMDDDGTTREDLRVPENELGKDIRDKVDDNIMVTVLSAMGEESAIAIKNQKA